ncbi:MAG: hypothetical protein AVDCRST_MAG33-3039 [uncultured Thermomicrobiales bacterium]|uniref:Uncharacterized protein n=1 Tax=uncultured Thermomicrobiales bacterium TaxID=1645740 RepID=A0A6J4VGP8_9BACT|nr:MAG: hypothetical protein AVDCRST_MAG33-3039 [uncultured Thermomicrobiales bacterium]
MSTGRVVAEEVNPCRGTVALFRRRQISRRTGPNGSPAVERHPVNHPRK